MNTPPPIIDSHGRLTSIGQHLASGGEGAVYSLRANSDFVAKLYHASRPPSAQTIEKLNCMVAIANVHLQSVAAWPSSVLRHARTKNVVGFTMPRLVDYQPIQHLYNPIQRIKHFPRVGWAFQVRAARNLGAAFDEIHKAGCLVGDINQSNVQVSQNAFVKLIDCDSFQVCANGKRFLCEVGVPHYTPPELQGKSFRGVLRSENHDRFGLAVLIYQLLFVGRHPYAGVYQGKGDPSFEQLISEYRFAQGPAAPSWEMRPPPHTPVYNDVPRSLFALFRRAFERSSHQDTRPKPIEWVRELAQLEQQISECPADSGHKHWRGVSTCVWCRIESNGGPEYYFGVGDGTAGFSPDDARMRQVLAQLERSQRIDFQLDPRKYQPKVQPAPAPLPEGIPEHRSLAMAIVIAIVFSSLLIPIGAFHQAFLAIGTLGLLVFGGWWGVHTLQSPWNRERRRRKHVRDQILMKYRECVSVWEKHVAQYEKQIRASKESEAKCVLEWSRLSPQYEVELARLTANAEANALSRHMRLHLISDAEIPKVGAGRKQTLASYGIYTAADVDEGKIRNISGFGDALTNSLVSWSNEVARQFRFNRSSAVPPTAQRTLTVQFRGRQQRILSELEKLLPVRESLGAACSKELLSLVPNLRNIIHSYAQANADFRMMDRNRSRVRS